MMLLSHECGPMHGGATDKGHQWHVMRPHVDDPTNRIMHGSRVCPTAVLTIQSHPEQNSASESKKL